MTLRQAEAWLGLEPSARGRRLKRILLGAERKLGRPIMVRIGTHTRVTRSAIRKHCRHMLPSQVDELREKFTEFLGSIDEKIETRIVDHVAEHVEPKLEELWDRDEVQARAIKQLAERVKRIAGTAA
jgi:hypothetical protein